MNLVQLGFACLLSIILSLVYLALGQHFYLLFYAKIPDFRPA